MFRPLTCILGLTVAASPLAAGPWTRAPGSFFLSTAVESPLDPQSGDQGYTSLYYEYGMARGYTLGADLGVDTLGYGKAIAFLRKQVWSGSYGLIALELGGGSQATYAGTGFAVRPGISWGRDISLMDRPGWVSAEATLTYLPRLRRSIAKLETTFGLTLSPNNKIMVQFTAERETAKPATYTLTPTYVAAISPHSDLTTAIILSPDRPARLKLGIWMQF